MELLQVYTAVTTYGISVCNVTFDGCPTNFTLCSLLGASLKNVKNLQTKLNLLPGNLYAVPDPSHMVKLIRNCFGERQIIFDGDGSIINFKYIKMLLELQENEGMHICTFSQFIFYNLYPHIK